MPSAITVTFSPQSGPANTPVTVFISETTGVVEAVKFNGTPAWFDHDGSGAIATRVPVGATSGRVSVTISGVGAGTYSSTTNFVVTQPAAVPTITSFSPAQGAVNTTITVMGSNLGATSQATIGGAPALLQSVFPNQVVIQVLNATSGPIRLSGDAGTAVSSASFTVTNQSTMGPVINSFSPATGPKDTNVTIFGSGFSTVQEVTFGGVPASFTPGSDTQFTARVPADAPTGKISVRNALGTSFSAMDFVVTNTLGAPSITSFTPTSGAHPDEITIFGQNLGGVSQVTFNNVATSFTPVNNTQLRARVPMNTATGRIRVTNPNGTATSSTDFVIPLPNTAPKPRIDAFSPQSGDDGIDVVITGQFFTNVSEVRFAGLLAQFIPQGDGQLTAKVPINAESGPISLMNPGGTTFSALPFTVSGAPTLPPPSPNATGIKIGEALDAGFEPTVDNEEAPSFKGSADRRSGVLTLISGQSKTISLIAERTDLRLEKVDITVTPARDGFTFDFPEEVNSFVPFNFTINTAGTVIDQLYRFEIKGKGKGPGMADYDPFILDVQVIAPVEVILPTEIQVMPGKSKSGVVRIVRRRFADQLFLNTNPLTSSFPPNVDVSFIYTGTTNNSAQDRGGKVDTYDLKVTAPSQTPVGNYIIGVAVFGGNGINVKFPSKKVSLKVVGIRVDINGISVSKSEVGASDTFEVTYTLSSFGYEGTVSVTAETPYYEDDQSLETGVRARMPQPAQIQIAVDENKLNNRFTYNVLSVQKSGKIILPLAAKIPNAPATRDLQLKIHLIKQEVVIGVSDDPITLFGAEKRNYSLSLSRVPPFQGAFQVRVENAGANPATITPLVFQVPATQSVARFEIMGNSPANNTDSEYVFIPYIAGARDLGKPFSQIVYYRPTENYVQLRIAQNLFPLEVLLEINDGVMAPKMAPRDTIRFDFKIFYGLTDVTNSFDLSTGTANLTASKTSAPLVVKKKEGMKYMEGKYTLQAVGMIGQRNVTIKANVDFEITGAISISPQVPVAPPIRTPLGSRTNPLATEESDSID